MAKLSVHGEKLLTLEYPTCRIAHMSDGKILRNSGNGWKLYKKVKPGINPVEYANQIRANRATRDVAMPNWAEYVKELCAACSLDRRHLLHTAIEMMPDDPDGVWSETTDHCYPSMGLDIQDVVKLCILYKTGLPELKAWQDQRAQKTA